jgi:hypothetical protein
MSYEEEDTCMSYEEEDTCMYPPSIQWSYPVLVIFFVLTWPHTIGELRRGSAWELGGNISSCSSSRRGERD